MSVVLCVDISVMFDSSHLNQYSRYSKSKCAHYKENGLTWTALRTKQPASRCNRFKAVQRCGHRAETDERERYQSILMMHFDIQHFNLFLLEGASGLITDATKCRKFEKGTWLLLLFLVLAFCCPLLFRCLCSGPPSVCPSVRPVVRRTSMSA